MKPVPHPLSVVLVTLLFVLALSGRYPVGQTPLGDYGIDDLRAPGCLALSLAVLLWHANQRQHGRRQPWPRSALLLCALIGLQMLSALWAPSDARLGRALWDLTALLVLVAATAVLSAHDPVRAARVLLILLLVTATVYALSALAAGPQDQGRYAAFGGGPNIFARVTSLGIIATAGLAAATRRWLLLLPLPVLTAATILSGSRGALVSLVIAATVFFLLFARRRFIVLAGTLVIGSLVSWAVWILAGTHLVAVSERRYSLADLERSGYSARPGLLSEAWAIFVDQPYTGAGLDSFQSRVGIAYPHNFLAGLAVESGLTAVLLAVIVILCWWREGRPWATAAKEQIGCAVGAVYIATASMFSGDLYDTRFCWILGIVAVYRPVGSRVGRNRGQPAPPPPDRRGPGRVGRYGGRQPDGRAAGLVE